MTSDGAFTYQALPMRVLFGSGRIEELPDEATRLGLERVVVLSTPGRRDLAERAATLLAGRAVGIFAAAREHVPLEVANAARDEIQRVGADGCVAVGGGSNIGLGKAITLDSGLPVIAVPTTYAGSEMTPIWGLTEANRKRTGRDLAVLPRSVIYDPELTVDLPAEVSGTSGINAIAHAVEALYAPDTSPVVALFAEEGVRSLAAALPAIAADPGDRAARHAALRGAWLCGACLGVTTMSLQHKLCHVLGGKFDLPHAATHAVVLPYVAAYNLPTAPAAADVLCRALRASDPARALADLGAAVGAPRSLGDLGLRERDLPTVVDQVITQPYANPRGVTGNALVSLLTAALHGTPPQPPSRPLTERPPEWNSTDEPLSAHQPSPPLGRS